MVTQILDNRFPFSHPLLHPYLFLYASVFFIYSRGDLFNSSPSVVASPNQPLRLILLLSIGISFLIWAAVIVMHDRNTVGYFLSIFVLGFCSPLDFFLSIGTIISLGNIGGW